MFEAIYKKGDVFKYSKIFQCDNGSEFKSESTNLLDKRKVNIRRITTKCKHTHTAFLEAFSNKLEKQLFRSMNAQELQDPKKVSVIWHKSLNSIVNKISKLIND